MGNNMHACESIPYLRAAVIACGGDTFSVGRPGHVKYSITMPSIGIDMIATRSIPHLNSSIYTARNDILPIGRPAKAGHIA